MSKSLFKIENEYWLLAQQIMDNEGEASIEEQNLLAINKEELQNKATNYGMLIKSLEGENLVIDSELDRLSKLAKQRSKLVTRLKTAISEAMKLYEVETIKTPLISFSFRKSESVEIVNVAQLDKKFMVEKTTVTPDKTAIKEAIKKGEEVEGAILQVNQNLQIK